MRARASRLKRSLPLGHSARIEVSLRCVARLRCGHGLLHVITEYADVHFCPCAEFYNTYGEKVQSPLVQRPQDNMPR